MKYYIDGIKTTEKKLMILLNKSEQQEKDFYKIGDRWFHLIIIDDKQFTGEITNLKTWEKEQLTEKEVKKEFNRNKTN